MLSGGLDAVARQLSAGKRCCTVLLECMRLYHWFIQLLQLVQCVPAPAGAGFHTMVPLNDGIMVLGIMDPRFVIPVKPADDMALCMVRQPCMSGAAAIAHHMHFSVNY